MAFVVPTKRGGFEVRESHSTPKGPRSRTLVTFKELNDEAIERARARSKKSLSAEDLRKSALRAGASVPSSAVDRAGRETIRLLAKGERLDPKLRRLLLDALSEGAHADQPTRPSDAVSDSARAATEWIGVSPEERGKALRDLLELADALPIRLRPGEIGFPRLRSV